MKSFQIRVSLKFFMNPMSLTRPNIVAVSFHAAVAFLSLFIFQAISLSQYRGFEITEYLLLASFGVLVISVLASVIQNRIKNAGTISTSILAFIYGFSALAIGLFYSQPTENLSGGMDEGVYAITSINASQTKTYALKSNILPEVPESLLPWVTRETPAMANRSSAHPETKPTYHTCFFIRDFQTGSIASQFPIGYPILNSAMHSAFGFQGMRWLNPILMTFNAFLLAIISGRALGTLPAAGVFILSLLFPLNVWISNSFFAEPMLQTVWLIACVVFLEREKAPMLSMLILGLSLGISLLIKLDGIAMVGAIVLAVAAIIFHSKKIDRSKTILLFLAGAITSLAAAVIINVDGNQLYFHATLKALVETNKMPFLVGAIFSIILASSIFAYKRLGPKTRNLSLIRWVLSIALIGLALYAYFLRPLSDQPDTFFYWPYKREIESLREQTFVRLGWYFTPVILAITVIGASLYLTTKKRGETWLFVALGLVATLVFTYDLRNNPMQPYAMRRFVPFALPFLVFSLFSWYPILKQWEILRKVIALLVIAFAVFKFSSINQKLNAQGEYKGMYAFATELSQKLPEDGIFLFPRSDKTARLASVLQFAFGRDCLILDVNGRSRQYETALSKAISDWKLGRRETYLITESDTPNLGLFGATYNQLEDSQLETSVIDYLYDTLPKSPKVIVYRTNIYDIQLRP